MVTFNKSQARVGLNSRVFDVDISNAGQVYELGAKLSTLVCQDMMGETSIYSSPKF